MINALVMPMDVLKEVIWIMATATLAAEMNNIQMLVPTLARIALLTASNVVNLAQMFAGNAFLMLHTCKMVFARLNAPME